MTGTKEGSRKAVATILARDPGHFARAGRIGGQNGHTGGFATNPELARIAGAKGGHISKRRPAVKVIEVVQEDAQPVVIKHSIWKTMLGR
ncbi:hypothetical protein E3O44_12545 [Cryobacterium algoricola]|uniref:Uncharacterized protein n=1 Tax=Cryobacterium algoricola TaxID=1259183 RepID=A0ABY2IAG1_9MICO|nr:hypothetical protein [Cryobacterium algoricola]TFB85824.1 hypothetical protein E3O44_12545 [Cryobacterium algoricola]